MFEEQLQSELKKYNVKEIVHPIFYNFPNSIRFKIGVGEIYDENGILCEEYISNAYNRAKKLYEVAMPNKADLFLFEIYPQDKEDEEKILKKFREKISDVDPKEITIVKPYNNMRNTTCHIKLYWDMPNESFVFNLFSETILGDLGGFADIVSSTYLFDLNHHVMVHFYDDRGLDIVSADKATIFELYKQYNDWILDYDREKINKLFLDLIIKNK